MLRSSRAARLDSDSREAVSSTRSSLTDVQCRRNRDVIRARCRHLKVVEQEWWVVSVTPRAKPDGNRLLATPDFQSETLLSPSCSRVNLVITSLSGSLVPANTNPPASSDHPNLKLETRADTHS